MYAYYILHIIQDAFIWLRHLHYWINLSVYLKQNLCEYCICILISYLNCVKVFWLIRKLLTELAMFGYQSWTPKGPNISNSVNRIVIRKKFKLRSGIGLTFSCVSWGYMSRKAKGWF